METADLLHSAAIRVLRMVRVEDAQAGIGPAQLSALSVLVFGGAKTVSELAVLEQVRPPTMSRIVDGLVRKKLVQRVENPEDRRMVRISATARGEKLMLAGKDRRVKALASRFEALTATDLKTLHAAAQLMLRL
ncbi:MAG TPA: MarR family transcriptional regulator [Candidatus Acidoferrum sp.]